MTPYVYRGAIHDLDQPIQAPPPPRKQAGFDPSACGTYAGYRRHQKHRVPACDACLTAQAEYSREYDRRLKNGHKPNQRGFNPSACGTFAGYRRHMRAKVTPCAGCRAANTAVLAKYREAKRNERSSTT